MVGAVRWATRSASGSPPWSILRRNSPARWRAWAADQEEESSDRQPALGATVAVVEDEALGTRSGHPKPKTREVGNRK